MSAQTDIGEIVPDDELTLWTALRQTGATATREKLFSRYAAFARNIARRLYRESAHGDIDYLDVQQLAYAGLLESIERFDPARNVPFRSFAAHRIIGSVRDGMSRMTEVREQISWRHRARQERLRSLAENESSKGDDSTAMEKLIEIAVGLALGFMLEGTGLFARSEDPDTSSAPVTAYDSAAWKEVVSDVETELRTLPEREQFILRHHYLNDVGFDELASLLQLSKGRISQLHRAALQLLKKRMAGRGHFRLGG